MEIEILVKKCMLELEIHISISEMLDFTCNIPRSNLSSSELLVFWKIFEKRLRNTLVSLANSSWGNCSITYINGLRSYDQKVQMNVCHALTQLVIFSVCLQMYHFVWEYCRYMSLIIDRFVWLPVKSMYIDKNLFCCFCHRNLYWHFSPWRFG